MSHPHTWNYRVIKRAYGDELIFGIHEVHYEDGNPVAVAEAPTPPTGGSIDELREVLQRMLACLDDREILDYEEF